jgi:cell division protein FtsI (penicillin-binding protein 3)
MAVAFALIVFTGRLLQVQGIDSTAYAAQAQAQYLHTVTLPADRGAILDRNGVALADTVDARDIYGDPLLAKTSTTTNPGAMAYQLSQLLGVSSSVLVSDLVGKGQFVYLARGVTPKVADEVAALNLPGVGSEDTTSRIYPAGDLAANVLGFVGTDGTGLGGLEYEYQKTLAGTDGTESVELGHNGETIPDGVGHDTPAVAGDSIQLTIDSDIQWKAQQAITAQVAATGASGGTVVVMQPKTGQILALATTPTFDPTDAGASPVADRGNAPLSDVFEPGSTNKVITVAAAIDSGVLTPNSPIDVPSTLTRADTVFHDAEDHGDEHLTLTGVLAESSNIGAIEASEKVGVPKLYSYLQAFGLGQPSGLDFPGESAGILPPPSQWSATQRYTIPFGQGVSVNALQVASVYSTIANGGVRVTPTLVQSVISPDGAVQQAAAPTQTRVVSASTAEQVETMLEAVTTDEGTAPEARIPGYRVAGKTGTADRSDPTCGCYRGYTASFVGFAPADNPQLVVLVVLDDPIKGHYGGAVAAPVFKDVMSFALESEKIPPTGTKAPVMQLTTP